ncbi:MAG: hypothetical protein JSU68_01665, partial [Phycisphaerales bacterium]
AHTAAVLGALQEIYDFVVVDGPYRLDPCGRPVFDLADINYLVIQLSVLSIRSTQRMLDAMRSGGLNINRVSLVCNRYSKANCQLTVEHAESTLGRDVAMVVPDDFKTCCTALDLGEPLCINNPKKPVRLAIRELAERTREPERLAAQHKEATRRPAFWAR